MSIRRVGLVLLTALVVSACGASGVAPPVPTPTPTPPPGTVGTVTGLVSVAASRQTAPNVPVAPLRRTPARSGYIPNQLMVKFRTGIPSSTAGGLHVQVGASVVGSIDRLGVQILRLAPGVSAPAAVAAYRASGLVEYVEQDAYVYASATPNDPRYVDGSQWHYPLINLPLAWDTTTGGPVIVAVLDTGIRFDHPDLAGVTVPGFDFFATPDDSDPTDPGCPTVDPSDFSHGTHVSGTVAALTNNSTGVAGVNWGGSAATKIMPIRVLGEIPPGDCGTGENSDIASAIMYAADHGAKVINMSLGGPFGSMTVDSAISYARARGVTLVAAAGNDVCGPVLYPARNSQVIAVAAVGNGSPPSRASYSNCGPELDVAAPGGDGSWFVLSTTWRPLDGFTFAYVGFQGTSMATPHVSGVVALMISRGWTDPAGIQTRLQNTATDLPPAGKPDTQTGHGLINAPLAIGGASASTRMRAFSGVISGSIITRQSDIVDVTSDGSFTITNAQTGTKTVFVWQNFNGNGFVDTGDYFGQTPGVVINPGATTPGVLVTVQRYSGPPLSVPP